MTYQYPDFTGRQAELDLFGKCSGNEIAHLSWPDAVKDAMDRQPNKKCRKAIILELLISSMLGGKKVKLYTSVGTAFDVYHGVDAFFECEDVIVTVDLTLNSQKEIGRGVGKADVTFNPNVMDWEETTRLIVQCFECKMSTGLGFIRYN